MRSGSVSEVNQIDLLYRFWRPDGHMVFAMEGTRPHALDKPIGMMIPLAAPLHVCHLHNKDLEIKIADEFRNDDG